MLHRIDDCKGRCACFADPETGLVEHKYKDVTTSCRLQIGEEYTVKRDGTVTVLKRTGPSVIRAKSYELSV